MDDMQDMIHNFADHYYRWLKMELTKNPNLKDMHEMAQILEHITECKKNMVCISHMHKDLPSHHMHHDHHHKPGNPHY